MSLTGTTVTLNGMTATAVELGDAYAGSGTYELTAAATGISPATVRNLLIEVREHYSAETTIQAYRAALAVGDLATPRR